MVMTARCALYLLPIINFFISCSADDVFIWPSKNITCPSKPCLTLNELTKQYITSENITSIYFYPGNHHLYHRLFLINISNVVLTSLNETVDNTVIILFETSMNIIWTDCNNISIIGLIFKIIGTEFKFLSEVLAFEHTTGFLSHLSFHSMDLGYNAVIKFGSSCFEISDMTISNVTSYSGGIGGGAAINAMHSTISFHGVNTFVNNIVFGGNGGALHFSVACNITFYGQVLFVNNTSETVLSSNTNNFELQYGGGAVYSQESIISFLGEAIFVDNQATYRESYYPVAGGAILIEDFSTMIFKAASTALFTMNIAASNGGAVAVITESHLIMEGKVSF